MHYLITHRLFKTFMPWVYEVIISVTCRNVSKTYGVYVNVSDVLTISILYSDIHIPIQQYMSYNMGLLRQTWRFKSFLHAQGFDLCSYLEEIVCLPKRPTKEMQAVTY